MPKLVNAGIGIFVSKLRSCSTILLLHKCVYVLSKWSKKYNILQSHSIYIELQIVRTFKAIKDYMRSKLSAKNEKIYPKSLYFLCKLFWEKRELNLLLRFASLHITTSLEQRHWLSGTVGWERFTKAGSWFRFPVGPTEDLKNGTCDLPSLVLCGNAGVQGNGSRVMPPLTRHQCRIYCEKSFVATGAS